MAFSVSVAEPGGSLGLFSLLCAVSDGPVVNYT